MRDLVKKAIALALQLRVVRAYLRYSEHRGATLADSITYRALFSIFAAVLLGFSVAALWLRGNPEAMQALTEMLENAIPVLGDVVDPSKIGGGMLGTLGVFAVLGLVGAALSAIGSLRTALRVLSDQLSDDTFFLWVLLRNLLVGLGFGGLLIAGAVLGMGSSFVVSGAAARILGLVIVFVINTAAVALVFALLSGVKAPAKALWVGAALGGAGLLMLQELSSLFVRGATSNPLLGTFAALIALLLWVNLSVQVILIASSYIIVATDESRDRVREKFGAQTLAQHKLRRAEDVQRAATLELRRAQDAVRHERAR